MATPQLRVSRPPARTRPAPALQSGNFRFLTWWCASLCPWPGCEPQQERPPEDSSAGRSVCRSMRPVNPPSNELCTGRLSKTRRHRAHQQRGYRQRLRPTCVQPLPSSPLLAADHGKISLHCNSGRLLRRVRMGTSFRPLRDGNLPALGGAHVLNSYVSSDSMPFSGKLKRRHLQFGFAGMRRSVGFCFLFPNPVPFPWCFHVH